MALLVTKYLANQAWAGKLRDLLVRLFTDFLQEILLAGSNVTVTYDEDTGTFTFASSGGAAVPSSFTGTATEALTAGRFVNIDAAGEIQHADSSTNSKMAQGYILASYADGATDVEVYFDGVNDDLSGLTAGESYFLSTAGQVTTTAPTGSSPVVVQFLGTAISATELLVNIQAAIERPA
jgi:hypothetical protein